MKIDIQDGQAVYKQGDDLVILPDFPFSSVYTNENLTGYVPGLVETLTINFCTACFVSETPIFPSIWIFDEPMGAKFVNSPDPPDTPRNRSSRVTTS